MFLFVTSNYLFVFASLFDLCIAFPRGISCGWKMQYVFELNWQVIQSSCPSIQHMFVILGFTWFAFGAIQHWTGIEKFRCTGQRYIVKKWTINLNIYRCSLWVSVNTIQIDMFLWFSTLESASSWIFTKKKKKKKKNRSFQHFTQWHQLHYSYQHTVWLHHFFSSFRLFGSVFCQRSSIKWLLPHSSQRQIIGLNGVPPPYILQYI